MPSKDLTAANAAQSLADFSSPALIQTDLRSADAAGAIGELSQLLQRDGRIPELLPFYHAALNREYMTSSATDQGLAIPHARCGGVAELIFALGRSSRPILWGPKPSALVQLVFLTAIPLTDATGYLHLISGLASLSRGSRFFQQLLQADSNHAMFETLRQIRLRGGRAPV